MRCEAQQVAHRGNWPGRPPAEWAATRRQQPLKAAQLACRRNSRARRHIAGAKARDGPALGALGTVQGKVSTFTSRHRQQRGSPAVALHVIAAAHGHGGGGRNKTEANSPEGLNRGQGPKKKGGPTASWGPGVPTPGCLHQQGHEVLIRLRVLGSLPWLIVN